MKLLQPQEAKDSAAKQNIELAATNLRLRENTKKILDKLDTAKGDYGSDKLKRLKDYEDFCRTLNAKKSRLLAELDVIEKEIAVKKDLYYALIDKQDELDEKLQEMSQQAQRLDLREAFVRLIEEKQKL